MSCLADPAGKTIHTPIEKSRKPATRCHVAGFSYSYKRDSQGIGIRFLIFPDGVRNGANPAQFFSQIKFAGACNLHSASPECTS